MPDYDAQLQLTPSLPTSIDGADLVGLLQAVAAELDDVVPGAVWTEWGSMTISKPHPSNSEVRVEVVSALSEFNNHVETSETLSLTGGDTTANPTRRGYREVNGKRVSEWAYQLDIEKPSRTKVRWEVTYDNGNETFTAGIDAVYLLETDWDE